MPDLTELYAALKVAADDDRFEAAVMASPLGDQVVTRHPLGFHVVKVETPGAALRLHLWKPGGVDQPGYEVHDHIFNLKSRVVVGAIRHRTYAFRSDAAGDHVVYAVKYSDGESRIAKTDRRVQMHPVSEAIYQAGDTYSVAAGELHDAELLGHDWGVTLVLTGAVGGTARTIGPWDGPSVLNASRGAASADTLKTLGLDGARLL
ncbi:hypothetical protein JIX59_10490 [Brevundimonas diminuta]|uniref:hypothetical protein n=1 Tax=Brevundimonas diminuta TaxID=293 RepID=UPI0019059458|nr:hypothetical protein [Brevundimonas diminuta]MBK1969766.1 hypothetical protein [Brevundimonas diminuta]MDA0743223.1 hypothetical protein [Pseudomonadota bacterium]MDA1321603.1 hypothetical protein [Pseudomonadota bacterium]